jgi:hypothetical protein
MDALDGNAIAGELLAYYGHEMTAAKGACAHCEAIAAIAELDIYGRMPATVARCRACGNVVMVIVSIHGATQIHAEGLRLIDAPGSEGRSG